MSKIYLYFRSGMAANSTIFERIQLPKAIFEMYFLEWFLPEHQKTINYYALL
ncbi:MAG: hypothetical protein ACOYLT_00270 [Flavobacterium sp.]|jgi:hypothetical protein|uniref:hypothetical protein n=1 Tax=Flavobacterium sp. TaxID=239 RepID=UPI003BE69F39